MWTGSSQRVEAAKLAIEKVETLPSGPSVAVAVATATAPPPAA
jgi:hypothetical protein